MGGRASAMARLFHYQSTTWSVLAALALAAFLTIQDVSSAPVPEDQEITTDWSTELLQSAIFKKKQKTDLHPDTPRPEDRPLEPKPAGPSADLAKPKHLDGQGPHKDPVGGVNWVKNIYKGYLPPGAKGVPPKKAPHKKGKLPDVSIRDLNKQQAVVDTSSAPVRLCPTAKIEVDTSMVYKHNECEACQTLICGACSCFVKVQSDGHHGHGSHSHHSKKKHKKSIATVFMETEKTRQVTVRCAPHKSQTKGFKQCKVKEIASPELSLLQSPITFAPSPVSGLLSPSQMDLLVQDEATSPPPSEEEEETEVPPQLE